MQAMRRQTTRQQKYAKPRQMPDLIKMVADGIEIGAEIEDIREDLLARGLSEYEIFLTYKAAKLVADARKSV